MRKPNNINGGMRFVRYGGLSPVKQKGFTNASDKTYHSPPARKGIYAFPEYWVEQFLLGGDLDTFGVRNRTVRLKDKNGNLITNRHPLFNKILDRGEKYWDRTDHKLWPDAKPDEDGEYSWDDYIHYITTHQTPRKFIHNGNIWHHLENYIPNGEVMRKTGSWVLTSMDTYKKAFKNEMKSRRKEAIRDLSSWYDDDTPADAQFLQRNPYKWHSKDHLEVFIERIKS